MMLQPISIGLKVHSSSSVVAMATLRSKVAYLTRMIFQPTGRHFVLKQCLSSADSEFAAWGAVFCSRACMVFLS